MPIIATNGQIKMKKLIKRKGILTVSILISVILIGSVILHIPMSPKKIPDEGKYYANDVKLEKVREGLRSLDSLECVIDIRDERSCIIKYKENYLLCNYEVTRTILDGDVLKATASNQSIAAKDRVLDKEFLFKVESESHMSVLTEAINAGGSKILINELNINTLENNK